GPDTLDCDRSVGRDHGWQRAVTGCGRNWNGSANAAELHRTGGVGRDDDAGTRGCGVQCGIGWSDWRTLCWSGNNCRLPGRLSHNTLGRLLQYSGFGRRVGHGDAARYSGRTPLCVHDHAVSDRDVSDAAGVSLFAVSLRIAARWGTDRF